MADNVEPTVRSRMMAGIRGSNTQPEILLRRLLHRQGFRFRLQVSELPGKPDIVLSRYHAVLFVHGCFWHGHDCPLFRLPKTRTDFWLEKINGNRQRDQNVEALLLSKGWRIGIVWECALRGMAENVLDNTAQRIGKWLQSGSSMRMEEKK